MDQTHNHPIFTQGREQLAFVVRLLLVENRLSHVQMQDLYRWSAPATASWFASSQVSALRNAHLPKPGAQLFVAIAEINLRLAQLAGDDSPAVKALDACGPLPTNLKKLRDTKPFYVTNPDTGLPMDVGDLFLLYCGKLVIEQDLHSLSFYTAQEAKELSGQIAVWAQRWMVKQGLIPLLGRAKIMECYPAKEKERQERIWDVVLSQQEFTADEVLEEADSLRFLVGCIDRGSALTVREFDRWRRGVPV